MSGTVLGTAAYMAPEQLEGHKPGPPTDIYSFAVVAFETLSGKRAYEGRTPIEIAHRKASDPPPSLSDAWPAAPAAAVELLARAMGPDPAARPATATALVDELERALRPPERRHRPLQPPCCRGPRRRRVPAADATTAPRPERPPSATPSPRRRRRSRAAAARGSLAGRRAARGGRRGRGILLSSAAAATSRSGACSGIEASRRPSQEEAAGTERQQAAAGRTSDARAGREPPAPAPTQEPPTSSGDLRGPGPAAGDSAAEGQRLNAEGKALSDQGDYDAAIPVLERAVRSFPAGTTAESDLNYAFALFNLGHALTPAAAPPTPCRCSRSA